MISIAEGQRAQAEVLGIEETAKLQGLKMILESEIEFNVPENYVTVSGGGGDGLSSATESSVMFMANELTKFMKTQRTSGTTSKSTAQATKK